MSANGTGSVLIDVNAGDLVVNADIVSGTGHVTLKAASSPRNARPSHPSSRRFRRWRRVRITEARMPAMNRIVAGAPGQVRQKRARLRDSHDP